MNRAFKRTLQLGAGLLFIAPLSVLAQSGLDAVIDEVRQRGVHQSLASKA